MTRTIFCQKLQKETLGLDSLPYPGEMGARIYASISQEAWANWLAHQTMLINEYRLNLTDPQTRQFLLAEMEKYLFGEGSSKPSGYIMPND